MNRLMVIAVGVAAFCAYGNAAVAQEPRAAERVWQSFDVHVPHAPAMLPVGGKLRLMYELHITSFASKSLSLTAIDVVDDRTGRVVGRLTGPALEAVLDVPGSASDAAAKRTIETGRRAVVYVDLPIVGVAPTTLRHRVEFEVTGATGRESAAIVAGRTTVDTRPLPILGPPLRGGPWVAVYDPMLERGHRRVVYAVSGKAVIPGRYAIDWMPAGPPEGGADRGDIARGAGAEVLAVADAVVAAARDGVAEPEPGKARPPVSLGDATGNYVALDIGAGRYAFYEHLAPGLSVKVGDRVRRGQIIGRLGSTGQASRPHLHFHLADANSPLAAEGEPYVLAGGHVVGAYGSISEFQAGAGWRSSPPSTATMFPAPNVVVVFPDAASGTR